jgi:N-acetylglucosaminyl-diphospho-decaprenol L-rhamnosyltransferase
VNRPDVPDNPEPARRPRITAVIVNYGAWAETASLVTALAESPEVRSGICEVVVVDNASNGPVPEVLRRPPPGVRLITRPNNGGFAVGVNAGWHAAHGPWLLVLNPDVEVSEGWLGRVLARVRHYEAHTADAGAPGVVGFALLNPDGSRQPSVGVFPSLGRAIREQVIPRSRRKYQAIWRTRPGPVDWVTGACLLVNVRLLEATGGLDEEFFLYYEEVALCRSAARLGFRVEYDPSVEAVHQKPLQNRPITPRMRVITRHSKLLYFRKHLPRWQFRALAAVVGMEARVRGGWARLRGQTVNDRAWLAIDMVRRELQAGHRFGGPDVLALADSVTRLEPASQLALQPDSAHEPAGPVATRERTRAGRES